MDQQRKACTIDAELRSIELDRIMVMHIAYSDVLEFFTLLILEMALGIDNLIFISIITDKLPENIKGFARIGGLSVALLMRMLMLIGASFILSVNDKYIPVFNITQISYRSAFLIAGGMFLIYKCIMELYDEISPKHSPEIRSVPGVFWAMLQIMSVDIMLSLDSVIAAVGITENIWLIGLVFLIYAIVAVLLANGVGKLVTGSGNAKVIALLFIGALGVLLALDGINIKVSHNYLYAALLFSVAAESVNYLRHRNTTTTV